jgi:GNAT superfamily N-acetyltransferase
MRLNAQLAGLSDILYLRRLFLQEANTQIRYNAVHERGSSDSYLLSADEKYVGYGSVRGQNLMERDTIFEFHVIPSFRHLASTFFQKVLELSKAKYLECQTNDLLLSSMVFEFGENIKSDVILFSDGGATQLSIPGAIFRKRKEGDSLFEHHHEPEGEYVLELDGEVKATGGFLTHYNMPFSDLYMEVKEEARKKGLGSYLIQEIKKESYLAGRIPAARCNIDNSASKSTLLKGGLKIAGYMLFATINKRGEQA